MQKIISFFEKYSHFEPNSGCQLFIYGGGKYSQILYDGKQWSAHRLLYFLKVDNNLTAQDYICHKCDTSLCIRLDHLYKGNAKTNYDDMVNRQRDRPWGRNLYKEVRQLEFKVPPKTEILEFKCSKVVLDLFNKVQDIEQKSKDELLDTMVKDYCLKKHFDLFF